jgi:glycosyltransferase involved in cell wall biosynthesis
MRNNLLQVFDKKTQTIMNTPKVSILIPVYNVSSFITRCVHSLMQQTLSQIEYIFVDDCSTDNSFEILKSLLEMYPNRIAQTKIITHEKNLGPSLSRNTAIKHATGEFILNVDSDDYLETNMAELLYFKAISKNADIVVCDAFFEYPDRCYYVSDRVSDNQQENFKLMLINDDCSGFLWNKMFKRELFIHEECQPPSQGMVYLEDRYMTTRFYYFAKKIVKVNQALYHYNQYNLNSITKSKNKIHFENLILFWKDLDKFLIEKNIYKQYYAQTNHSKIIGKARIMVDTHSYKIRKEYADLYRNEETECIYLFKGGEWLMLWMVRHKLFILAQVYHIISVIKNKKTLKGLFNHA